MIRPVAAIAAGALVLVGFAMPQAAGRHAPGPHRIVLVKSETGLAVEQINWSSADRASGELDLTGDGAAELGKVRVSVRRDQGVIVSLRLAGHTNGIAKSWKRSHGHWSAS